MTLNGRIGIALVSAWLLAGQAQVSSQALGQLPAPPKGGTTNSPSAADMHGAEMHGAEMHPTKEGLDLFEKKIRPALVRNCYECHSGDPKKAKGGFVLDTRAGLRKGGESGASIVPGNAEGSLLVE